MPPWWDDKAWLDRLRPLKGDTEARRVEVLAWGRAAGYGIVFDPARGALTLVVPAGLLDCPAKFALLKQAREVGLKVRELEGVDKQGLR